MPKATQVGAKKDPLPEVPQRKCEVCGTMTNKPYGLTRKGCVCSRECQEEVYHARQARLRAV